MFITYGVYYAVSRSCFQNNCELPIVGYYTLLLLYDYSYLPHKIYLSFSVKFVQLDLTSQGTQSKGNIVCVNEK